MNSGVNSPKPTTAQIVGGVYNATPPTLIDGQACSLQLDINGNLKVNVEVGGGGGGGAGFGFQLGAIVAGATGNTPTGGFTLSDGAGNTSEFGSPDTAGFTLTGASGSSITEDGTVPSTTWDDGMGNLVVATVSGNTPALEVADSFGNGSTVGSTVYTMNSVSGNEIAFNVAIPHITLADSTLASLTLNSGAAEIVTTAQLSIGSTHQTTVGAAGSASTLPLAPTGYWVINVEGTKMVVPYYAAS